MLSGDRSEIRRFMTAAWRKYRQEAPLEPIERIIAAVIREHPEYHALIEQPEASVEADFSGESHENPFLHLGLHIALLEQIGADRPGGIAGLLQRLAEKLGDRHLAEHRIIDCLAQAMWQANRDQQPPDERLYLKCIRKLL